MSNRPKFNVGGLGTNDFDGVNTYVREIDIEDGVAVHGLSNAFLDTNWGTVERGKDIFGRLVSYMGCRGQSHLSASDERPQELINVGEGLELIVKDVMMDTTSCRVPVTGREYVGRASEAVRTPVGATNRNF